jgi:WhiB family redox-sensing transcriptional regulator
MRTRKTRVSDDDIFPALGGGYEFSPPNPDAWKYDAACRTADPDLFIPVSGHYDPAPALAFCARCSVVEECRAYALSNGDKGVWGGIYIKYKPRRRAA